MNKKDFKKYKMPDSPGVYFFKKGKDVLYIGKATSLKERVKSYFSKNLDETRGSVLVDMIEKSNHLSWHKTDSVLEALILEAFLIKKYQPKYNTKEKSDKSFNYVCITKDKKLTIVRGKILDKKKYDSFFGPFPNNMQLREALKIVRKIFPYFDYDRGPKGRDEFYKQIKLVPINSVESKNNIRNIKLFFSAKKKQVFKNLKKEMISFAKKREFEKAGEIKKQIFALQHINDVALIKDDFVDKEIFNFSISKQNVLEGTLGRSDGDGQRKFSVENFRGESENSLRRNEKRIEAYDIAHMGGKNMVGVMVVLENGEFKKEEYRKFKIKSQNNSNDTGALKEVLERRFGHKEWRLPNYIVLDGGIAQLNIARKVLKNLKIKIDSLSVVKDEKHKARAILGVQGRTLNMEDKKKIISINTEAHRFAIAYHKNLRNRNFLK